MNLYSFKILSSTTVIRYIDSLMKDIREAFDRKIFDNRKIFEASQERDMLIHPPYGNKSI